MHVNAMISKYKVAFSVYIYIEETLTVIYKNGKKNRG